MRRQVTANRLLWASAMGSLVWLADQPTVAGYQPLVQMFWDPGIGHLPLRDYAALSLSWLIATLFCHLIIFALQRARARNHGAVG